MNDFSLVLRKLLEGNDFERSEAAFALGEVMDGKVNAAQIAAFLTALKVKGETVDEIAAFAEAMRTRSVKVRCSAKHLVDTCGTGGDGAGTFNISTCAAFVAAGAGAVVAKHGNRAASSRSGSADVLEELGVNVGGADSAAAERQLNGMGIAFLFAPLFHPAMKNVAPVRKELGFKTVFNFLGPLANPAGAKRQVIGVCDGAVAAKMAEALKVLETEKALVVSSDTDEVSLSSETRVFEVSKAGVDDYVIAPEDFGFKRAGLESIRAEGRKESAGIISGVLNGVEGSARDIVLLNAGAAVYASGVAETISQGVGLAGKAIDSGKALEKLELLRNGHP